MVQIWETDQSCGETFGVAPDLEAVLDYQACYNLWNYSVNFSVFAFCSNLTATFCAFPTTPGNPDWYCHGNQSGFGFQSALSASAISKQCVNNSQLPSEVASEIGSVIITCLHLIGGGANIAPSFVLVLFFFALLTVLLSLQEL